MKDTILAATLIVFCFSASVFAQSSADPIPAYKDSTLSTDTRVQDLIQRMTIDEKIGQISTLFGWEMYTKQNPAVAVSEAFREAVQNRHIGLLWGTLRADPWTQKTLETGLNPQLAAEATNSIQKYAIEETRLGIPLLLSEECPHGHMAIGTTVFPTSIGLGSTWNPELIEKMSGIIALEVRAQGGHNCYGPVLDLARDPRWSRVEETYGEDPVLVSRMGEAMVKGFQGNDFKSSVNVISTLKHFAAYGSPIGGHNGGAVLVGQRELHTIHLPPFKAATDAGALSVMTAYNSVDGIPNTSNSYLLNDILRKNWGFDGFVVSDLGSIEGLRGSHRIAETFADAASLAINAGVDADLGGNGFGRNALKEALDLGYVSERTLDEAVGRVLRLKFEMGLFENPYVDPDIAAKSVRTDAHIEMAREVARQSVTLIKNEGDLLPLKKNLSKIAVIGPNAHNIYNQLGDYTAPQPEENIVTVFEGIQNSVAPGTRVTYVRGTAIRDTTQTSIDEAVEAAKNADAAIVVLGGSSARDFETAYIETGAAAVIDGTERGIISDMESGEGYDRATLDLLGKQLDLLKAVKETGTPTVLVLIKGRPLLLNWPSKNIPAIVDAWYPGQEGGNAIADVLFGDYNPAGRLPISVPRSVGQLPVYYNTLHPQNHDYVEMEAAPLYSFGHGLSYSTFQYDNLEISVHESDHDFRVSVAFSIENTSMKDGDEVVQLYVRDDYSSVVTPVKQLKAFKRVHLKAGEQKKINFELTPDDLKLLNLQMEWTVEPGSFTLMAGASSEDIRLYEQFLITRHYPLPENSNR